MIVVIDYGMGNLRSVAKAVEKSGYSVKVSGEYLDIKRAKKIILPGVGAFGKAMENLKRQGILDVIKEKLKEGTPYLGICLGLQLLFEWSEEGNTKGMGVIKGVVKRFPNLPSLKIPHMGWNKVKLRMEGENLFDGIPDNSYFYFTHSYYVIPVEKEIIATTTFYGVEFVSSIKKGNLFACQFHPEKSGKIGLKLLENFLKS
ncbi:MAG TPA: imidazole glycerol phosphate synthase subunit HisH [bacterium]|nr:imidazole glycerol phosphate synthase subunit HisH [bacterium]HEX67882.1 imidazole glycerol phosphate synthase subunit HisH [bacterium]